MAEGSAVIERNPITGEPVIVAPDRAHRPNMYRGSDEECPFCAGNESLTPPEIARTGEPWRVRVFANKYPATDRHEVIVESPVHDATFDRIGHAGEAVRAYVDRYQALTRDCAHVTIFKNHGPVAGASITHLHSQIIGTPFVPPRIEREAAAMATHCGLCGPAQPLIRETDNYRWVAPRGPLFAYEQWIVPKRHAAQIAEPSELATLLQASAAVMQALAGSFNWIFVNFPARSGGHWYVQLFPRFAVHAGFELGSASSIVTVSADETVARFHRQ